jgi:hypothetical protein
MRGTGPEGMIDMVKISAWVRLQPETFNMETPREESKQVWISAIPSF